MNDAHLPSQGRFHRRGPVDVAVVLTTRDSIHDVRELLPGLRRDAARLRLRLVVTDAGSSDGTRAMLTEHPDVLFVATGATLGRAEVIDAALAHAGAAEALLLLSPDIRLDPPALGRLLARLRSDASIGAVAPLLRHADGTLLPSLRRRGLVGRAYELLAPTRTWSRPVRDPRQYAWGHAVAEADGGALLVSATAARRMEAGTARAVRHPIAIDLQRRLRAVGWSVWIEPAAAATRRALPARAPDRWTRRAGGWPSAGEFAVPPAPLSG